MFEFLSFLVKKKKEIVKECSMLRDIQSVQISESQYFNFFFIIIRLLRVLVQWFLSPEF